MRNIKVILQYEGTRYQGWQRQDSTDNTIQGKLEDLLGRMCGRKVEVIGSGRTDAGVHAYGQTANFHIETEMELQEIGICRRILRLSILRRHRNVFTAD